MARSHRTVFVLSVVLLAIAGAVAIAQLPEDISDSKITISKETTHATSPVTKDGYIDYLGAVNASLGKGVNADNNANVKFWQAFGPHPESATMVPKFFKLMGIDSPPEEGNYFLNLGQYVKQGGDIEFQDPLWNKISDHQAKSTARPWLAKEHPQIAGWLLANEKPLAVVVEGTKRSEYYSPLVVPNGEEDKTGMEHSMIAVLLPGVQQTRSFARALSARAMLRTRNGDTEGAWEDLMACHQLGRLVGRGPTLIEALVGIAIDGIAGNADLAFLEYTKPDSNQIAKYQKDLAGLAPLPSMGKTIGLTERYMFLDVTQRLSRSGSKGFSALTGGSRESEKVMAALMFRSVDWDTVMRTGNHWYDRLEEASKHESRKDRKNAMELVEADMQKFIKEANSPTTIAGLIFGSKKTVGKVLSRVLVALLLPAVSAAQEAEDRSQQKIHNLQLAFALAAYRSDHEAYPESLKQLAPKYLKQIPSDMYSSKGLVYQATADSYLLYSFGRNEKDDGGRTHSDKPSGDDLRVRMPLPAYKK